MSAVVVAPPYVMTGAVPDPASFCWEEINRTLPLMQDALDASDGADTLDDVRERILAGTAQAWPGVRSVIVTEVVKGASGERCFHTWLAGGDLGEIAAMIPAVEAFGRAQGCTESTIDARPGWARVTRPHGYVPVKTLLRKAI